MIHAHPDLERGWLAKGLAGLVLGFVIAIGLSGLLAWTSPGGIETAHLYLVAMWAVAPIWLLIFAFCFLFGSGLRAWSWLGGASLAVHLALLICRAWA
jgi:hypothetical protein